MKKRIKALSLFANVGIAEAYLEEIGIDFKRRQDKQQARHLNPRKIHTFQRKEYKHQRKHRRENERQNTRRILVGVIGLFGKRRVLFVLRVHDIHFPTPEQMCHVQKIQRKPKQNVVEISTERAVSRIYPRRNRNPDKPYRKIGRKFCEQQFSVRRRLYLIQVRRMSVLAVRRCNTDICRQHEQPYDQEIKSNRHLKS